MTIEANKQVVLKFIDSLSAGKPDENLLCDDVTWWVPGMGTLTRAQFFGIADNFSKAVKAPAVMTIVAVTAEEDRVAVEANGSAELTDGRRYDNTYHFLFYLRDGKIHHAREHNDSRIPTELFKGALASA